jgi:hypothetical protein
VQWGVSRPVRRYVGVDRSAGASVWWRGFGEELMGFSVSLPWLALCGRVAIERGSSFSVRRGFAEFV